MFDLDLFVIGGGSGGVRAARIAAQHGARVAIAEASRWGGTCVVRGCIPKKLMVYASEVRAQLEDARGYGWTIEDARVDWPALIAAKDREIDRLSGLYRANLEKAGAQVLAGRARFIDANTIAMIETGVHGNERRFTAANVLIATGGHPRRLVAPGAELAVVSDDVFHLPELPRRIVILGGGYIGVEFAHIFAGLGSEVVLAHRATRVLPGFDDDVRTRAETDLGHHGVVLRAPAEARELAKTSGGIRVIFDDDGPPIETDLVLAAIGRDPSTHGLGLETIGVALGPRGAIVVDDLARTSVPNVFAVGDVTARVNLTPVAIREGHAVADTLFGGRPTPVVLDTIPTAVFAQPAIAAIGLTEAQARARGEVTIYKADFRPLKHTLTGRPERMLIKLVCDRDTRRVLGLHVVGADAAEIVQAAAIAITMGATKDDLDRTFALHPTAAEELVLLR
ncbi:MAG TPA: glutathione-disulfide reductase [Kofleriaceae bacterium]|nr:glutathione-disulfide reductase [Kofleriaceae bacterium]